MTLPDRLRLRILSTEDTYLCGTDSGSTEWRVRITSALYTPDIEYLSEGDTVMLLDLAPDPEQPDTLTAQRLIVEPDYLIDISSLAACFTECGPHPMRYLLSMLAPKEVTMPILLGNTANQFLDDCVNHSPERPATYNTSIRKAFATDALKFAVCPDINASFFSEARNQYDRAQEEPCWSPHSSAPHWAYRAVSTICRATYAASSNSSRARPMSITHSPKAPNKAIRHR